MEEELIETIEGVLKKIIYKSPNYMVSSFETLDGSITVTGPSFDIEKDAKYVLVGKYIDHPKYGFQFELLSISKYMPSAKEEIIKYLSSPTFKGVGKKAAEKIYDVLGDETLRILKKDNNALEKVNISDLQKRSIIDGLASLDDLNAEGLFSLINIGFTSKEAHIIFNHFKERLNDVLLDNPFQFYLDVYGIPFMKVLECAKKCVFDDAEEKYKEALLVYLFKDSTFASGDIYLFPNELENKYRHYYFDFDDVLNKTIEDKYFIIEEDRIYLSHDYHDENYIAGFLKEFYCDELIMDDENLNVAIKDNAKLESIEYDEIQIEAIKNFYKNNFSMVVGGPGTGKTTLIKALVDIYTNYFPFNNIIVIAPTGRAAKRINEICDVPSKTIHSLLRWNKEDNTFIYNEDNPIDFDTIIIDEFSMVDNGLFASLLKACPHIKKMCIIGDDNQLPSIRQGNVLYDLIQSNEFKLTRLNTVHRQKEGNEIIDLANDIVLNQVDLSKFKEDISFIDIKDFNKEKLVQMINQNIQDGIELDDIQVLSPMYRGEFGIDALNSSLQSSFNPKSKDKVEKRIADCVYRENDKILQLKNRPDDDVYNGDIGNLEEISIEQKTFLINYKGVYVYYNFEDCIDISLAYALSVHKSQGSEYNIIYFICSKEHRHMLYKKLVYTAISRAKSKLIIIGDKDCFMNATKIEVKQRKTTLLNRLKTI